MDALFWTGLILGGLIGVVFDLWRRPLDRLLDRRLGQRAASRAEVLAKRVEAGAGGLRDYLVEVILQTTLVGALIGILSGLAFGLNSGLSYAISGRSYDHWRWLFAVLTTVGQALAIGGAAYIVRLAADALAVARRLNRIEPEAKAETE
jgi:hypothetical protein